MPQSLKNDYQDLLESFSNEMNLPIHSLNERYVDMSIWNDSTHVAINQTGIIYSYDVANLILDEIRT